MVAFLFSILFSLHAYANQDGIYVSAADAKNMDLTQIAGTYSNRLGFEMIIKVEKEEIAGDLFTEKGYYIQVNPGVEWELFSKVPFNVFPEPSNELSFRGIDEKGTIFLGYTDDDCQDPGCSNVELQLDLKKNRSGNYYAAIAWQSDTHQDEMDFDYEDMDPETAAESLDEQCRSRYSSKVTTSITSNFNDDWSYCYVENEVFLSKK